MIHIGNSIVIPPRPIVISSASMASSRKGNPFDKYDISEEIRERTPKSVQNQSLVQIIELFQVYLQKSTTTVNQKFIEELAKGKKFDAKSIEQFSLAFTIFQDSSTVISTLAGRFLSAIINNSSDQDFTIHTQHLDIKIDELGFENIKNMAVMGDLGNLTGNLMKKGLILVKGSVGYATGHRMEDGEIFVEKDCNGDIAPFATGGVIRIDGKIIGELKHKNFHKESLLKIYYHDKLIAENGKLLGDSHV